MSVDHQFHIVKTHTHTQIYVEKFLFFRKCLDVLVRCNVSICTLFSLETTPIATQSKLSHQRIKKKHQRQLDNLDAENRKINTTATKKRSASFLPTENTKSHPFFELENELPSALHSRLLEINLCARPLAPKSPSMKQIAATQISRE